MSSKTAWTTLQVISTVTKSEIPLSYEYCYISVQSYKYFLCPFGMSGSKFYFLLFLCCYHYTLTEIATHLIYDKCPIPMPSPFGKMRRHFYALVNMSLSNTKKNSRDPQRSQNLIFLATDSIFYIFAMENEILSQTLCICLRANL